MSFLLRKTMDSACNLQTKGTCKIGELGFSEHNADIASRPNRKKCPLLAKSILSVASTVVKGLRNQCTG
ncbi:hypothetical protein AMTR_s04059p00004920, partial [Amborella trichopoda]